MFADAAEPLDATDVAAINAVAARWKEPQTELHPVAIERIIVAPDALEALCEQVSAAAGGKAVLLVVDRTPMWRGSAELKPLIEGELGRRTRLSVRRLPEGPGAGFRAELIAARRLADELRGFAVVVSVGSGSITDVVKYARHLCGERSGHWPRFVCFPTAASVTAYTSALAVLTVAGVKRTLPARPPDAVVCDLRTLADAPPSMTRAGFGDVLARSVSYADWYLSWQLGLGGSFSQIPVRLLAHAGEELVRQASAVGRGDQAGVRALTDGLLLAGMAMSLVNQTAPLSGWEHAISHFLDLIAALEGREPALHGAQVGVATLISAHAYQRAWTHLDVGRLTGTPDEGRCRRELAAALAGYRLPSELAAELWRDVAAKLDRWRAALPRRREFVKRWQAREFDGFLSRAVRPPAEVAAALRAAGAPCRFAELDQPVPDSLGCRAVRYAHLVRARFSFGDLLSETGWLNAERVAELVGA